MAGSRSSSPAVIGCGPGGCCWPLGSSMSCPPSRAWPNAGATGWCTARTATAGSAATCRWRCSRQAIHLRRFSPDVVLCLGADFELSEDQRKLLAAGDVTVLQQPLTGVGGAGATVQWLDVADGSRLDRSALFVHAPLRQRSDLPTQLGCQILDDGAVEINDLGQTSVPGVYAAGDMARRPALPLAGAQVVLAAAEGTLAAIVIDQELLFTQP